MPSWLTLFVGLICLCIAPACLAKALVYCTDAAPDGFDSAQSDSAATHRAAAYPLYNRLLSIDPATGKPIPDLAASWAISGDGKIYTFILRHQVAFHSTAWFRPSRAFNADDVVWSLLRQIDPTHPGATGATFPGAISANWAKLIRNVEKLDPHTVRITLRQPFAPLLTLLASWQASIISAEYAEQLIRRGELTRIATEPVGTGPFQFVKYERGQAIRYAAHPDYFGGRAAFDKLVFGITPDASVRVQKLRTGECGLLEGLRPQDMAGLQDNPRVRMLSYQPQITSFLAFNTEKKPFADARVRQALSMAIDRNAIVKTVFEGRASVGNLPYSPQALWGAPAVSLPVQDLRRAKELLREAGYPDGFSTTLWVRVGGGNSNVNPKLTGELIQADWAKLGVKLRLIVMEAAEMGRRTRLGEHDTVISGWQNSLDPDELYSNLLTCDAARSSSARWCDAEFDQLISKARTTTDERERAKHYAQAGKRFIDAQPWAVLAYPQATLGYSGSLQGVKPSAAAPFAFGRLH